MSRARGNSSGRRAFSLVELLVVVVVLAILAAIILPRLAGSRNAAGKAVGSPMTRTRETVCAVNLRTVRQAIEAARASDPEAGFPASLADLKLPAEVTRCDVGGEAYVYDPQAGQVHCPHPGHEKF